MAARTQAGKVRSFAEWSPKFYPAVEMAGFGQVQLKNTVRSVR
jgi:hypothetical protein